MSKKMRGNLMLLLTALIWGTAFVAQSVGMDYVEAFTFSCVRNLVGGMVLIPCIFLLRKLKAKQEEVQKTLDEKMERWMYLEELAARIAEQ